jgi:hypothetical protein
MSTRVKQCAVIDFLTAEKVTPTETHRRLKAVYGDDAVDRSTVNLLKRDLKGNHYTLDDEVKAAVKSWIREKSEEFFSDGMKKLVTHWEKCVSLNGDYVEK